MKRIVLVALLLSVALTAGAATRQVFNINRDWKFFSNSEVSSDGALTVNLPHMWNTDALSGKKDYFRGIGNYLKEIDIPNEWRDKRVFIKGYGANSICNVLVNGKHVGEHRAGYTAFAYEITDYLNFGRKNFFWLIVNNSPQMDVLPVAGDQNSYGGLFRDVELIVTGREIVSPTDRASDGLYVMQKNISAQKAECETTVKVSGVRDNNVTAELTVLDDQMRVVASNSAKVRLSGRTTSTVKIPFTVDDPRLWNGTLDPYMYNVSVKITSNQGVTDSVGIKTGFRFFEVTPQGQFLLNGEPYRLKGVIVNQDRAMKGTAITGYQILEDFELIARMGANAVRVQTVSHHPGFYELCDRFGIIVWSDLPLIGATYLTDKSFIDTESFRNNAMYQGEEIVRQHFNHPSVVMWGLFANLSFRGDNPTEFISKLNLDIKREDPTRLTVATSNEDGEINFITDLVVWDHYFGWREGLPQDIKVWSEQFHSSWNNLRSGVSYAAGGSIYHQEDSLYRPSWVGNWHPERWQTHFHEEYFKYLDSDPLFWGIFVGNMFDYGAAGRTWGEGNGINDYGLVTFDRKYCKDAYYFYKANWNTTDRFVRIGESRWIIRRKRKQDIRVYSNCEEVELFVNGVSHGWKSPQTGIVIWPAVDMQEGTNILEVRSGDQKDTAVIEILNSNSRSVII